MHRLLAVALLMTMVAGPLRADSGSTRIGTVDTTFKLLAATIVSWWIATTIRGSMA